MVMSTPFKSGPAERGIPFTCAYNGKKARHYQHTEKEKGQNYHQISEWAARHINI